MEYSNRNKGATEMNEDIIESFTIITTITPRGQSNQRRKWNATSTIATAPIVPLSSSPVCLRSIIVVIAIYAVNLIAYLALQNELLMYDPTRRVLSRRSSEMTRIIEDSKTTSALSYYIDTTKKEKRKQSFQETISSTTTIVVRPSKNSTRKTVTRNGSITPSLSNGSILNNVKSIRTSVDNNIVIERTNTSKLAMKPIVVPDEVTPVAFVKWNDSLPCYKPEENWRSTVVQRTPTDRGIIYIKTHKTGSSTGAGINLRIARNLAKRQQQQGNAANPKYISDGKYEVCQSRFQHSRAAALILSRTKNNQENGTGNTFDQKSNGRSVLWTIIREPTARSVSAFFHFAVSRNGVTPTDNNFITYVTQRKVSVDYYLRFLYTKGNFTRHTNHENVDNTHQKVINSILKEYDFIGITERMDESAVVLMMLFNLKMSDILYLRSKTQGGYDAGGGGANKKCTFISRTFVSPGMKDFFLSERWKNMIKHDQELYHAVNISLDMTIDSLGREKFEEQLIKFRDALQIVEQRCRNTTVFPCDNMGISHKHSETDCLWSDSGCGTNCIDNVSTELGLW